MYTMCFYLARHTVLHSLLSAYNYNNSWFGICLPDQLIHFQDSRNIENLKPRQEMGFSIPLERLQPSNNIIL